MIKEEYVSFETAKLLKEKGFNQVTIDSYRANGQLRGEYKSCNYPCPTQQMAMRWLREIHQISVRPRYDEVEDKNEQLYYVWFYDILSMKPYKTLVEVEQGYDSYEEAVEAAIKYCLENLI